MRRGHECTARRAGIQQKVWLLVAHWLISPLLLLFCLAPFAHAAPSELPAEAPELEVVAGAPDLRIDGRLDEPFWASVPPATDFIQREPSLGQPASERTLVRVASSDDTLYLGIRCFDSEPEAIVANEMRRDVSLAGDDSIVLLFDTFHDRRNAYFFEINSNGARRDLLITDEGRDIQPSWDGVWRAVARRDAEGWTAEVAIPFTTLLFAAEGETWGFNVRRLIRRKNEEVYWSPLPLDATITRVSLAGRLVGLDPPKAGIDLQLKPFAVAASRDDRREVAALDEGETAEFGIDAKWGISRSLTANLTVNTDFAETEVDALQVNLTRFSLFFPEKREFFLENAGIFDFGFGSSASGPPLLKVFHSRRIGIGPGGLEVPVEWGARLTGRQNGWSLGALHVATEGLEIGGATVEREDRSTVVRVTRDVGLRSRVGILATERDPTGLGASRTYGIDASVNPLRQLNLGGFWTSSETEGRPGDGEAWGLSSSWNGARWRSSLSWVEVDEGYSPELGFLLRRGVRQYLPNVQFLPRPEWNGIRNLDFQILGELVTDLEGEVETVASSATLFGARWQSGDYLSLFLDWNFEELDRSFEIVPGVVIPAGEYVFPALGIYFETGSGRRVSASGFVRYGDFYDGDRFDYELRLVLRPNRFVGTETVWTSNDIRLPAGDFDVSFLQQRVSLTLRPDFTVDTYLQLDDFSDLATANVRFRWSYRPGADLFLVYNHNWTAPSLGDLATRDAQIVAKVTYLLEI